MSSRNFHFIPDPKTESRRIQNAVNVGQEDLRAMDLSKSTKPLNNDERFGYPIEIGSGVLAAQN